MPRCLLTNVNWAIPLAKLAQDAFDEIQRLLATKEPSPEQLEVSLAAMAEILRAEPAP